MKLFDQQARVAFVVAVLMLGLGGIGFRSAVRELNVVLRKKPVDLRMHLSQIPEILGDWESAEDVPLDEAMTEELGTRQYLNRIYRAEDGPYVGEEVLVHVAYYTGMIDAVPHIPDRCFVAAGWSPAGIPSNEPLGLSFPGARDDEATSRDGQPYRLFGVAHPVTGRVEQIRLPFGEPRLRVSTFTLPDEPEKRLYGGFLFVANHRVTPNPAEIRALAFQPWEQYAYFAKVQISLLAESRDQPEKFVDLSSDLLHGLLPHLMRCLPDWAEVDKQVSTTDS
jgi:hypothetical protein